MEAQELREKQGRIAARLLLGALQCGEVSTDHPPNGFCSGDYWTDELRIMWLHPRYYVYDRDGFICSTESLEVVGQLLMVQATGAPDPALRKFYRMTARGAIYPGHDEKKEQENLALEATVDKANEAFRHRRKSMNAANKAIAATSGADLLKDLGLDF